MECLWDDALLRRGDELPTELLHVIQNANSNERYLQAITQASLDPRYTYTIFAHCEKVFPHVCASLRLHGSLASAVATLGRIIPFAPYLIPYVERLLDEERYTFSPSSDSHGDLLYLLGLFRLLSCEPRLFQRFVRPNEISALLQSSRRPLVYLAIRILQIYLSCADHWFEQMVKQYLGEDTPEDDIDGPWDDIVIDYRFLTLWEEQRFENVLKLVEEAKCQIYKPASVHRILPPVCFHPLTALVGQILLPCGVPTQQITPWPHPGLAQTQTTTSNLNCIASALKTSHSLLLTGLAGSGKTSLVRYVAHRLGNLDRMITLHLNEQSDAKLLIGIHTTGDTPGTFSWKPGVLTTAVQEGRWILIEDLDRAPNEVLGTLLPLIEKRELLIPSRKQTIHAPHDFKIIATVQSSINHRGEESEPLTQMLGARHWQRVPIKTPPINEIREILLQLFPSLSQLLPQFTAVYQRLRAFGQRNASAGRSKSGLLRAISARDLLKWCGRVNKVLLPRKSFSSTDMDDFFIEAVDCFIGSLPDGLDRVEMAALVSEELRVDPQRRDYLLAGRDVRYEVDKSTIRIGRYSLPRTTPSKKAGATQSSFSTNPHTTRMLERVAAAVINSEPLLLVGETGVGKTSAVQHLAKNLDKKLVPFNLSQQSEAGDLLGGIKPVSTQSLIMPMKNEFDELFSASFSISKNQQFLTLLGKQMSKSNWKGVCKMWQQALKMVEQQQNPTSSTQGEAPNKKRKIESKSLDLVRWEAFATKVSELEHRLKAGGEAFAFSFVEGNIVKAVRNGDWVLLDEINLASTDTLESITDLLDADAPSLLLMEAGNVERIQAHPDFRIFAAMNPPTDIGKKDLPPGIRSRFTELYVESPDKDIKSLQSIVRSYLRHELATDQAVTLDVSALYQQIISLADQNKLVDGAGQKPHFSLRTLTRTLSFAKFTTPLCSLRRALYEGFQMSFLTFLDGESAGLVQRLLESHLFGKTTNIRVALQKSLRKPSDDHHYVQGYPGSKHWVRRGDYEVEEQPHYILTPFIRSNLENLVRAASTRQFPVLIQGPTSSGKTSMIEYLANRTGHKFVRINNHEHTDLQEYLGTYISGPDGRLQFEEGILVKALRCGHWIVLDELNLAPTDVLEALNRLLDDNRELLVPETQEIVRPHENFMLFATQNPAGLYGGRKALSRAFRNRFLELHFADIPIDELQDILQQRTQLPESRCKRIVAVYRELSVLRQENRLFEQKSFATLRDLFRWALRPNDTIEQLASNGFMLLAERVRKLEERRTLKAIIEKAMSANGPRVSIDEAALYAPGCTEVSHYQRVCSDNKVVWTQAMRRLYALVSRAIQNNEPVLLVGETGCGKTTVCQMLAHAFDKQLHTVNAHQNTEAGDLIGSQRPVRNRAAIEADLRHQLLSSRLLESLDTASAHSTDVLLDAYDRAVSSLQPPDHAIHLQSTVHTNLQTIRTRFKALFEWVDGSLVQAMKSGTFFLLDEISLADDAVLERINSVLEPQRLLLLAEKGSLDSNVVAKPEFRIFATMNPGGDYGKRELSPALRNRFTEIWVPPLNDIEDITQIVSSKLANEAKNYAAAIVAFALWFKSRYNTSATSSISIRDVLTWVDFVNIFAGNSLELALIHGAAMVYIDTLGANPAGLMTITRSNVDEERTICLRELGNALNLDANAVYFNPIEIENRQDRFIAGPFSVLRKNSAMSCEQHFSFEAPTTRQNTMRVVRALQLRKPVMLEGSPGVGKTALVTAIAQAVSMPLTRVNLSEQTDLLDLFGSDVPVGGEEIDIFAWRDAPFLRAMKNGEWVLLDEMNLASQSVLEGLNACLDHRGEVFIPELGQTFIRHPEFRLFAAQNPHHQGGGRKGLPASFVNRFTVVFTDAFRSEDLTLVSQQKFPHIDASTVESAVQFVEQLEYDVYHRKRFGTQGGPWEFNLRDLGRWLSLSSNGSLLASGSALDFVDILFSQRFRSVHDEPFVRQILSQCFESTQHMSDGFLSISTQALQLGLGLLRRDCGISNPIKMVPERECGEVNLRVLQSLMVCVQQTWPVIISGPSGAGKTALIEHLASLVGASVVSISMNAETDAIDLVGGYEQADTHRESLQLLNILRDELQSHVRGHLIDNQGSGIRETLIAMDKLTTSAGNNTHISEFINVLGDIESADVQAVLRRIKQSTSAANVTKFEWMDGLLIDALREGKWLVLDNANLSSPTVLDRLNSLLEPEGVLVVNEHGSQDGTPEIIRPHPKFRIFLVLDPRYGELSRAMRNRCVELYLPLGEGAGSSGSSGLMKRESALARFRQAKNLSVAAQQRGLSREIAQVFSDHLGIQDSKLLLRYERQLAGGLYGDVLRRSGVTSSTSTWQHLKQGQRLEDLYQACISQLQVPSDFTDVQTLHPLNNQALVHSSQQVLQNACSLAFIHDTGVQLASIENELASIEANPVLIAKLRRLERSFLLRHSPKRPDPKTSVIVILLRRLIDGMAQSLEKTEVLTFSDARMARRILGRICAFCNILFRAITDELIDMPLLVAFTLFGQRVLLLSIDSAPSTISSCLSGPGLMLTSLASTIGTQRGRACTVLWRVFRTPTMTTREQLESILKFEAIMDRFDTVSRKSQLPLETTVELRVSTLRTLDLALHAGHDLIPLSEKLQDLIANVNEENYESFPSQTPHFHQDLGWLYEHFVILALDGTQRLMPEEFARLEYMAMRSSKHGVSYASNSSQISTQKLLRLLGSGINSLLEPMEKATPGYSCDNLLRNLTRADQVTLGQLDLLRAEVQTLGALITSQAHLLTLNELGPLDSCLETLTSKVLRAMSMLTEDIEVRDLAQQLLPLMEKDSNEASIPETIQGLSDLSIASRSGDQHFAANLHKVVVYLRTARPESQGGVFRAADAWAAFACACFQLYIPDVPFDPALESKLEQKTYQRQYDYISSQIHALSLFRNELTRKKSSYRERLLDDDLWGLGPAPSVDQIYRPEISQMPELQMELDALMRNIQPLSQRHKHEEGLNSESALWDNIGKVRQRLVNQYRDYDDFTSPIVGFIDCLLVSQRLRIQANTAEQQWPRGVHLTAVIPFAGADLRDWVMDESFVSAYSASSSTKEEMLWLRAVALRSTIRPMADCSSELRMLVQDRFEQYFQRWKGHVEDEQRKLIAKSSLYKFKGESDSYEPTQEEIENYFQVQGENHADDLDDMGVKRPQDLAPLVQDLHLSIFVPQTFDKTTIADLMEQLLKVTTSPSPGIDKNILPALMRSFGELDSVLSQDRKTHPKYDMYRSGNASEAKKLLKVLDDTLKHFKSLHTTWPEHATPLDVIRLCQEIHAISHSAPLAGLLPKVERLHATVNEWQKITSREYSAGDVFEQLTTLIIGWRQLELSTWAGLFDREWENCARDAASWWYVAYEAIIAATREATNSTQELRNHAKELLKTLEGFLFASGLGEFSARLRMLRGFEAQLDILKIDAPDLEIIRKAISNFISYFATFEEKVTQALSEGRIALEKEVKNVIQLASWKDRNIDVLRQSAQSSHRKLLRLVRKYRLLLARPVEAIIRNGFPSLNENVLHERLRVGLAHGTSESNAVDVPGLDVWTHRADRFKNPSATAKLIETKIQRDLGRLDGPQQLHAFLEQLLQSITELQKATPSVMTQENQSFVKHLKVRKRRLLADVLRELRQMGFQSSLSQQVLEQQASNATILSQIPASSNKFAARRDAIARYELYRLTSILPTVRECSGKHSEDLTTAEVGRCISLLESLVRSSIAQFSSFSTHVAYFGETSNALDQLDHFASLADLAVKKRCADDLSVEAQATCLRSIVDLGLSTLHVQQDLSKIDYSDLREIFEKKVMELGHLQDDAQRVIQLPPGIQSADGAVLENRFDTLSDELRLAGEHAVLLHPEIQHIIVQIVKWLRIPGQSEDQPKTNGTLSLSTSKWVEGLLATIDFMLGSIQDVEDFMNKDSIGIGDKSWLLEQQKALLGALNALQLRAVARKLIELLSQLHQLQLEHGLTLSSIRTVCRTLQPVLYAYYHAANKIITLSEQLCKQLSNMGYRLATTFIQLSNQGFCSPPDKSDSNAKEQGNAENGTGLGDGEGSEDISKDIKDDEDLSELARQKKSDEDRTEELKDEKDAVDMADEEMQGEAEDQLPGPETADDSEHEDVDDSGDLEEESGTADDVGPSAVDEKMWDGGKDEDLRDKEAKTGKPDTAENDLVAAEETRGESTESEQRDLDETDEDGVGPESEQIEQQPSEMLDPHTRQDDNLELPEDISIDGNNPTKSDESDVELSETEGQDMDNNEALPEEGENEFKDNRFEDDDEQEMDISEDHGVQESEDLAEDLDSEQKSDIMMQDDSVKAPQEADEDIAASEVGTGPDRGEAGQGTQGEPGNDDKFEESNSNMDNPQQATGADESRSREENSAGGAQDTFDEPNILFKKLGDVLQQWYDQHRPIQDAREPDNSQPPQTQQGDIDGLQFEHLPDENAEGDAQALGAAATEQSTALNDENAIQLNDPVDDSKQVPESFAEEAVQDDHDEEMMEFDNDKSENLHGQQQLSQLTSFVGNPVDEDGGTADADDYQTPTFDEMEAVEISPAPHDSQGDATERTSLEDSRQLWQRLEDSTRSLALVLTEHLRLILQPTHATKLRGDYRTGKRLNIKRVIPYIASSYKRDKIWMRRSVPSKRSYQVMLAIDDSKSMKESQSRDLAFETLTLIARSLSMLEAGELAVVGFGEDVKIAHDFSTVFSADVGAETLKHFNFSQNKTDVRKLLVASLEMFRNARLKAPTSSGDLWQLQLIISDGICEDHPSIRQLVRQAFEERIMVVFIVVDRAVNESATINEPKQSILDLQTAEFIKDEAGEMQLKMVRYLDTFPFGYYLIVRNVQELPAVLAGALRQWFTEVVETNV